MQRRQFLKSTAVGGAALAMLNAAGGAADEKGTRGPKIKVGQIGVGHAHAGKLSVFRQSGDYEVVGIAESNEELRKAAQSNPAYADLPWMTQEQLLNVPGLQLVLVETKVRDLLSAAEACVAAGKHVHLDKPAGQSLPQYRRILASAERQGLLVQMGYMFRYSPAVQMLNRWLKEKWLGDIFEVHAVMSKVVAPASRLQIAEFSGGMMFELGCHVIDLVVKVLGRPLQVTPYVQHASPVKDSLMDNMLAVFNYPRAIASVKSSALEVEGFERRHLVVCGTEGTFHIQPLDNPSAHVALSTPRGEFRKGTQQIQFPKYERYVDDAADIARVIRGEKATEYSYEHDLHVQETVLLASQMPTD